MSEDLQTPETQPASENSPGEDVVGLSESASRQLGLYPDEQPALAEQSPAEPPELGEEYKPYSQFPWHEIPEDIRPQVLEKLKKFHGDMSKGQSRAAELEKQASEFREKAQWFDALTAEPWFREAYQAHQAGSTASQQQVSQTDLSELSDYGLDEKATKVLQKFISDQMGNTVTPINQTLAQIQQQLVNDQVEREMQSLRKLAQEKNWPSPDEQLSRMSELMQQNRARTPTDAYRLAVMDDVIDLTAQTARQSLQNELKGKAERTMPPRQGPAGTPQEEVYTGKDAVQRAVQASIRELAGRQG